MAKTVFISWSGPRSEIIASALKKSLESFEGPNGRIAVWFSKDISPGADWRDHLKKNLKSSDYGIICFTLENIDSSWIVFEAGCLHISLEPDNIYPLLFDVKPEQIPEPINAYQCSLATYDGTKKLFMKITNSIGTPDKLFEETFAKLWPDLENKFKNARNLKVNVPMWSNVANIFWLGHDIAWTKRHIEQKSTVYSIQHGLRQILYHVDCLGISESLSTIFFIREFIETLNSYPNAQKINLPKDICQELIVKLDRICDELRGKINDKQIGYKPYPMDNQESWEYHKSKNKT